MHSITNKYKAFGSLADSNAFFFEGLTDKLVHSHNNKNENP